MKQGSTRGVRGPNRTPFCTPRPVITLCSAVPLCPALKIFLGGRTPRSPGLHQEQILLLFRQGHRPAGTAGTGRGENCRVPRSITSFKAHTFGNECCENGTDESGWGAALALRDISGQGTKWKVRNKQKQCHSTYTEITQPWTGDNSQKIFFRCQPRGFPYKLPFFPYPFTKPCDCLNKTPPG